MSQPFPCPLCTTKMNIVDSRPTLLGNANAVRRRRKCPSCDHRLTTYECEIIKDVEDVRFMLGRVLGLAKNAATGLANFVDHYEQEIGLSRPDRKAAE
jgi:hypothetical protein